LRLFTEAGDIAASDFENDAPNEERIALTRARAESKRVDPFERVAPPLQATPEDLTMPPSMRCSAPPGENVVVAIVVSRAAGR
jgi:hypothetical protein